MALHTDKAYILTLNDKCNNHCLFCFEGARIDVASVISKREAEASILQAKKSGYTYVDIFGGEPTVHPYLPDLIKLSSRLGLMVTLASNVRMFGSKQYAQSFRGLPIRVIRTSLHSHKAIDHDYITQARGSFKQTVAGIKNILKLDIPLLVNVVITRKNYKDLPAITRFIKKFGLSSIEYSGLVLEGRCLENEKIIPRWRQVRPYLFRALRFAKDNGMKVFIEKLPMCLFPENDCVFTRCLMPNFVKLNMCRGCTDKNKCVGVDRRYIALFPEDIGLLRAKKRKCRD